MAYTVVIIAFIAITASIWSLIVATYAHLNGWSKLAKRFKNFETFEGEKHAGQSASLGKWGRYPSCLTIGANKIGLFIAPKWIFSFGHPSLFIPWEQIDVAPESTKIDSKQIVFVLPRVQTKIGFQIDLGKKLLQHCPRKTLKAISRNSVIKN